MVSKLEEFLVYLEEQVTNHSIYVWGAQGQKNITEAWIRKKEQTTATANRAVAFWKKQVSAGYGNVLRAFDCSGLGMYWLQNVKGILKHDANANGLYGKCKKITKANLQPGDFVFHLNSSKRATHVGYVVDANLNVIEARGRDYGVVKRALSKGSWNGFGRPPFWAEDEKSDQSDEMQAAETDTAGYVFMRNLKYGCRGEDVIELKKLLDAKGYGGFATGNKYFLSLTKSRVKTYQSDNNLEVDGIAGPITITALGGTYKE